MRVKLATYYDSVEFKKYTIDNIAIVQDYNPDQNALMQSKKDTMQLGDYTFLYQKYKFRSQALLNYIYFKKDSLYSKHDYLATIQKLSTIS